jgi:hypothetical protein
MDKHTHDLPISHLDSQHLSHIIPPILDTTLNLLIRCENTDHPLAFLRVSKRFQAQATNCQSNVTMLLVRYQRLEPSRYQWLVHDIGCSSFFHCSTFYLFFKQDLLRQLSMP